jgi:hypothetical protein
LFRLLLRGPLVCQSHSSIVVVSGVIGGRWNADVAVVKWLDDSPY